MNIEVKKLDLKDERVWYKRWLSSKQVRRTALFAMVGALGSLVYFYFTEGKYMNEIPTEDILKSMLVGAALGVFITNSPCARGRC